MALPAGERSRSDARPASGLNYRRAAARRLPATRGVSEHLTQLRELVEAGVQPDLHALPIHAGERARAVRGAVPGGPEAGVEPVDLLHHGRVEIRQLDDRGPET